MLKNLLSAVAIFFCCLTGNAEQYNVFEENGRVGLKDQQGQVLIPASYEALGWSDGSVSVIDRVTGYKNNGMWGLINLENKRLTKATFSGLIPAEGNLLVAVKRSHLSLRLLAGCIDISGKEIIPLQYEHVKVNDFRVIVSVKSSNQYKYGLLDLDNKTMIPIQFRSIERIGNLRYAVENFQGQQALFSESGKPLTGFLFHAINAFRKDHAIVLQGDKQGVIDHEGVIKVAIKYKAIVHGDDGTFVKAKPSDQWVILEGQNKKLQEVEADSIISLNNNLFKFCQGKTIQLVNAQFTPITTGNYSDISPFINNKAIVCENGKQGIISSNGSMLVESKYPELRIEKKYIIASHEKKWIVLDSLGNRKTSRSYDFIGKFNGVLFPVKNRNYCGAIDAQGKEIISCVYDSLCQALEEFIVVKFHNNYGILDLKENWVVPPQPYPLSLLTTDRYIQQQEKIIFLRSMDNKIIYFTENRIEITPEYILEHVSTGGTWKIDLDGRIVSRQLPPDDPYEIIFPESEGLRGIRKDERYGFIDDQARLRIANRYEGIKPFQERMAAVKLLNKWGFVDHGEKLVIQPVFDEVTSFYNGFAIVQQKGLYGLLDKKGNMVLPARYQAITRLLTNRFLLQSDGLFGMADTDGRLISVPKFNTISDSNTGYLVIARDGKYGLITTEGISTIPLIYDYISCDASNSRYFALKKTAWEEIQLSAGNKQ